MKNKIIWIVVVILVIVVGFSFLNTPNKTTGKLEKVGLINILSGEYSALGQEISNGAILANEIYNESHPDSPVQLIIEDDEFQSKKALSAYKKLTSIDNIDALINVSTPSIEAIYGLIHESNKMVVLQLGEQPTEPTNDLVYGLFPGSIKVENDLGQYLKNQGYKKPLVVYTVDDTMVRFKNALVSGYGDGFSEIGIATTEKDFKTHALKAGSGDNDVIAILMFPQAGAQFINEYFKQNHDPVKFAFDPNFQAGFSDYERIVGDMSVLNGSIVATIATETSSEFVDLYKKRFNREPGFLADIGYDAFNLVTKTYDSDIDKWKDNMQNISYPGANGTYAFDEVGIRLPKSFITTIKDGKIVLE